MIIQKLNTYFIDLISEKRIFHRWRSTMITWRKWKTWVSCFFFFSFQWLLSIVFNSRFYLDQKKKFFFLTVFDLVAGVDVPAIEEKIAEYQKENADLILINQARKVLSGILLFLLLKQQSYMWNQYSISAFQQYVDNFCGDLLRCNLSWLTGWRIGLSYGSKQGASCTNW